MPDHDDALLGDAVRLPVCFYCATPLALERWQGGYLRCERCARGHRGRGPRIDRCLACDAALDPERRHRQALCVEHRRAYQAAKRRRQAASRMGGAEAAG